MRTNIVIDDKLIEQAMQVSGLTTKKGVVDSALREFVQRRTQKKLAELQGKIHFADGYDYKALREGR
jgi:Arc/MetJ family transcription regulator